LTQLSQMSSIAIENVRNAEAREANRIKDEFLATLSHELRTPLSAILGWTRTLRLEGFDAARAAHGLQVIERNVRTQSKLIDDLLDVSRIVAGKLSLNIRPVRMAAVIEGGLETIRPVAQAREIDIHFENAVPEDAGETLADPDRLQQVVSNLLSNAVKFTPSGGHVDVRLVPAPDGFEIVVRDTGRGIHPSFLSHVFDRFRQADSSTTRAQGGLGIGLAISRHLVELHGGTITAASAGENQGATFRVTIPAREVPIGTAPASAPETGPALRWPALSGVRVLVVEDEPDGRELLVETLHFCGAEVAEAASARSALRIFDTFQPDLVVTDIGMPGEDGYSLLRRLRQLPSGGYVPVIAVTAYAREEDRARALKAGFQEHVAKPFEPVELAALVERYSPGRSDASAEAAGAGRPRDEADSASTGCRVLVVEDDADSREGLRRLLELWGHPVEAVESASGAIEKALRSRPDVALIDIGLSDVDGYEVARRLRQALPGNGLFLVAMTGYVDAQDRRLAVEAGFDAHLAKPLDPSKLKELLASRPPSTPPAEEGEAAPKEMRPRA
jgi:CheY-like chemotaxis protein/nitrogen-specific signal transduction histidine kinase